MRQRPRRDTALIGSVVVTLMLASIALIAAAPPRSVAVAQVGNAPAQYPVDQTQTALALTVTPDDPYPYPYPYPYPSPVTATPTGTVQPYPYPYPSPEPTAEPAPTEPSNPYPYPPPDERAYVSVGQGAAPGRSVPAGSMVVYTVDIENQGDAKASRVKVRFSFSDDLARLLDVQLSRSGAWVSRTGEGFLEIRDPSLPAGDSIRARIRLLVSPDAQPGARLTSRVSASWDDQAGGGESDGNRLSLTIGPAAEAAPPVTLRVSPAEGRAGTDFRFSSEGAFIPGEPVALWYDRPDGRTIGIGRTRANRDGEIAFELESAGFAPGRYQMVAYGIWSGITATTLFQVEP